MIKGLKIINDYTEKKRILFICSPFFGYYKHIINELEGQGYIVDYYNDRPTENGVIKGIIKLRKSLINRLIKKYFEEILNNSKNKEYDKVLIINGKVFNKDMIDLLRHQQKNARFIFYTWDSIELYPNVKEFLYLFDKAYSFDSKDCENINELELVPLFYTNPYKEIGDKYINEKNIYYDILSICTVHPNRYKIIKSIFPELESKGIKIFSFMFLNRLQYLYNKFFVEEFKSSKSSEFKFRSLNEEQILSYIEKSRVVFDIPHEKQSGLTMRTIETLGSKKKLITTNSNIKNYDFYNDSNILVISEDNFNKIKEFINSNYEVIDEDIYEKYSIKQWVDTIINEKENNYLIKR